MLDAVVDYLPSPLDVPPVTGTIPTDEEVDATRRAEEPAVLGAGLQDRGRPVRRQAGLHPRLLRQARAGSYVSTRPRDSASASGRCCRCTPTTARKITGGRRRRHRRDRRPQADLHRRHALRSQQPDRARDDQVPRAGDLGWRSSRRPRPTRTRWATRWQRLAKRTRPSACAPTRRPARRSSPAWASCTWR